MYKYKLKLYITLKGICFLLRYKIGSNYTSLGSLTNCPTYDIKNILNTVLQKIHQILSKYVLFLY